MSLERVGARGAALLVVAPPGHARDVVTAALAGAGFTTTVSMREDDATALLVEEPFVAALVAQSLGTRAVAQLLGRAAALHPTVPVLVLGAGTSAAEAVDAFRAGAADYLPAPVESAVVVDRVRAVLTRARAVAEESEALVPTAMAGLIGHSAAMRKLYEVVERVTRYKTNVLLLGESGTGKELIARALHARGPHRQRLFVPLNCAALSREIIENELFGHERGAFTGANERKKGLFEFADGGTLFLDEIAEMDLSTQAKLLRVLERNEFRRLGGTGKIKVDVSIIAATNRDLEAAIAERRFREDLYYRLKVVTISVPPLRARKEDIPALVDAFVVDFNRRNSGRIKGIAPEALRRLRAHDWPGNVRELKNTIENAAVLAVTDTISADALDEILAPSPRTPGSTATRPRARGSDAVHEGAGLEALEIPFGVTLAEAERRIIAAYASRFGNRVETARTLGIGLRTLYTKLRAERAAEGPARRRPRRPGRR